MFVFLANGFALLRDAAAMERIRRRAGRNARTKRSTTTATVKSTFPTIFGCANAQDDSEDSAPLPQCSDNRDNDGGDEKIDYPADPGCVVAQQDTETDDCPDGPGCPQCGNGKDDDNNGLTDYPADPGCTSAGDTDEYTDNPSRAAPGSRSTRFRRTGW